MKTREEKLWVSHYWTQKNWFPVSTDWWPWAFIVKILAPWMGRKRSSTPSETPAYLLVWMLSLVQTHIWCVVLSSTEELCSLERQSESQRAQHVITVILYSLMAQSTLWIPASTKKQCCMYHFPLQHLSWSSEDLCSCWTRKHDHQIKSPQPNWHTANLGQIFQ